MSVASGEWKAGEFRTNLGNRVCASYSIPSSTNTIVSTTIQQLNGNAVTSATGTGTFSVNNPTPDVYAPSSNTNGYNLDIGQIVGLTNSTRKNNDSSLVDLQENSVLKDIAAIRVKDMFAKQYFEHNSPTGDNVSKEAAKNGYSYITIGENIALGNFAGVQGLVTAWMNSPGHRANILNKNYTEIGVDAEEGNYMGQNVWIAAQIFGKPLSDCTEPDKTMKDTIDKYKASADNILATINNLDAELKTSGTTDAQVRNSKVAERNTWAGLYNNLASEIKMLVAEYNKEAEVFNSCIKTL